MAIGWWRSSWGWKVWDSHSRWRLSLDAVTWSDATKIGLQHPPNARYPAPLWPRSTRKDHKPYSAYLGRGDMEPLARAGLQSCGGDASSSRCSAARLRGRGGARSSVEAEWAASTRM